MPIEKKTIRLLILEDSQNEAERIVSLFRNSGRSTRVHRLTSLDDLNEVLQHPISGIFVKLLISSVF